MIRSIFILAFLTITTISFSQGFELEFNIRAAHTSVSGLVDRFDPAWYCTSGINANYVFKNNSLLTLGLLYDNKGSQDKVTGFMDVSDNYWERDEFNFKYLTIPVQFAQRFGKKVKFQLGVGFYSSFLLNFEYVTVDSDGNSTKSDYPNPVKKMDFGLTGNFAVMVPVREKWSIKLGIDDYYGLTDVNNELSGKDRAVKHNSTGISLGFVYRIGSASSTQK